MEPTPLRMTDAQLIVAAVLGSVFLMLGVVFEAVGRPITPITAMPGLIIIAVGFGILATTLELYFPKHRSLVSIPLWGIVFWVTFSNQLSLLPLFVFEGFHLLSRAVAVFYFRSQE